MAGLLGRPRDAGEQNEPLARVVQRLDVAERALVEQREAFAERQAALGVELGDARERADRAEAAADALAARVRRLEEQQDAVLPLLTAALKRRLEAEEGGGEVPDMASALHRLDQQFKAHVAEATTATRALLERIEQLRRTPR